MERVLVIAAHPDDEVLGMGGTIAKYSARGDEVAILIVTDGSTSQYRNDPRLFEIIVLPFLVLNMFSMEIFLI